MKIIKKNSITSFEEYVSYWNKWHQNWFQGETIIKGNIDDEQGWETNFKTDDEKGGQDDFIVKYFREQTFFSYLNF